jgi:class 3 adenylate cyclase
MAKITLKNIFSKNESAVALITELCKELNASISIEDLSGKVFFKTEKENNRVELPVVFEDEQLGIIKGDQNAHLIKNFLNHVLSKEKERKKLGSEVLNLYQEINLIFNFSEKLAQTIGAKPISEITLKEASAVINSEHGVIVLWDEENKSLQVEASNNSLFFDTEKVNAKLSLLTKIILSGQSEILGDVTELVEEGIISPDIKSVIYSALKVKHRVMGAIILAGSEPDKYTAASLKLLTTLALQSSSAIESSLLYEKSIREANEREEAMRKIFDATGKFVPYQFIKSLGHEVITDVKLGDQVEKIVTVLFTDIRNYTSLSEQMTPEETFGFICSFNKTMGPLIRKHNGFINQYLGDSIMAIFPINASDALDAAIEMQKEITELNKKQLEKEKPVIEIGIGMHTGPLIMGITGDLDRMDACTISDTVNTASRVESLTKHFKASILLSDASCQQIENPANYYLRNLGFVQLKGKHNSIIVHECFACNEEQEIQKKITTLPIFQEGVSNYLEKNFSAAHESFKKVTDIAPEDRTARFFYNYTMQIMSSGVPEKKAGVVEMDEK